MGEQKPKNAAKDLVWGILLIIFGIYVVVVSAGMKATSQKTFLDSPGFFPLIVGAILAVFGAILLFIAIKCGGAQELKEVCSGTFLKAFMTSFGTRRVLILTAMMIIYMYVLIPYMPKFIMNSSFIPSTIIYLTATFFYLRALGGPKSKLSPTAARVIEFLIAVAVPFIVYFAFKYAFSITMP